MAGVRKDTEANLQSAVRVRFVIHLHVGPIPFARKIHKGITLDVLASHHILVINIGDNFFKRVNSSNPIYMTNDEYLSLWLIFTGRPPNCRPECNLDIDCHPSANCQNNTCINPCLQTCSLDAVCTVQNHVARCSCPVSLIS